jgi:glycosyltransferase involved in cell wall biosynthesis
MVTDLIADRAQLGPRRLARVDPDDILCDVDTTGHRIAAIIPARNEQQSIAATVGSAAGLDGVSIVIVTDDGSTDATGSYAGAAGAVVVRHERSRGKAAAVESGVNALGVLEQRDSRPESDVLLLLDGDLGDSAQSMQPLITPVTDDRAALAIGVLPSQTAATASDGMRILLSTARRGIADLCGFQARAPLSGQRCLTRRAFELASPLAAGFGLETGMTIDIVRAGLTVVEVDLDIAERASGNDMTEQLHRAKQLRDVTRALTARGFVGKSLDDLRSAAGVGGLLQRFKRSS